MGAKNAEQLVETLNALAREPSDPTFRAEADTVLIISRPSGAVAHILLLAVWLVVPAWLVVEEQSAFNYGLAAFWFLLWGRTFLSLTLSDTKVRIDLRQQTISVANMNPVIGWLRKLWPFKLRWEGDYPWSVIERFFVSYKVHTKMLSGHLVRFSTLDGKKVPVARVCQDPRRRSPRHLPAANHRCTHRRVGQGLPACSAPSRMFLRA